MCVQQKLWMRLVPLVFAASAAVRAESPTPPAQLLPTQAAQVSLERRAPALESLRIEQVCLPTASWDRLPGMSWNSLEFGISFSLAPHDGKFQPYTRYTCRRPLAP